MAEQPLPPPASEQQPIPDPKQFWPVGAISPKYKKVAFASIGALLFVVFLFSHLGSGDSQQAKPVAPNATSAHKDLPPSPSTISALTKQYQDDAERMKKAEEDMAKQTAAVRAAQGAAIDERTGQPVVTINPATGLPVPGTPGVNIGSQYPAIANPYQQAPIQGGLGESQYGVTNVAAIKKTGGFGSIIVQDFRSRPASGTTDRPVEQGTNTPSQMPPMGYPSAGYQQAMQVPPTVQAEQHEASGDTGHSVVPVQDKAKDLLKPDPNMAMVVLAQATVIEGVLENKLEGSNNSIVKVMISTPVYAKGTHTMLFPQGTEFVGEASAVTVFGQTRLAVKFHRAIVNQGLGKQYDVPLDAPVPGLDQEGAGGLRDKVNNHWLSTFGVAGVIGAVAGLSEIGNSTSALTIDPNAQFRRGVTQEMSQEAMQVFNRFLNRMPSVTIRPGKRVKLMLVADIQVPVFQEAS